MKRCDTDRERHRDTHTDSCIELRYAQLIKQINDQKEENREDGDAEGFYKKEKSGD